MDKIDKYLTEMKDELNPELMFQTIATDLLVKAVKGKIDLKKLAQQELKNRGLDNNGKWVAGRK